MREDVPSSKSMKQSTQMTKHDDATLLKAEQKPPAASTSVLLEDDGHVARMAWLLRRDSRHSLGNLLLLRPEWLNPTGLTSAP